MTTTAQLSDERPAVRRRHSHKWVRIVIAVIAVIAAIALVVVGLAMFEVTRSVLVIPKTEAGSSPAPTFPAPRASQMASLKTVAQLPAGSFIENLAVRRDGSILITEETKHQLWYLPTAAAGSTVHPIPIHTFGQRPMGIVETEPNVFYVLGTNLGSLHSAYLYRVDLRHWNVGTPVRVQQVLHFPLQVLFVDGATALARNVILVSDAGSGSIWRVDLSASGTSAKASEWLKDPSMALERNNRIKGVPGVNGIRYDAMTHTVYYTSTGQKLFMKERVDPVTHNPVGAPVQVAFGSMWDDFAIDDRTGVAYLTTHRQNSIERIPLDPRTGQLQKTTVAGTPLDPRLVGPSSLAWATGKHDYGSVAYVTTDGGATSAPAGLGEGPTRVLRLVLPRR